MLGILRGKPVLKVGRGRGIRHGQKSHHARLESRREKGPTGRAHSPYKGRWSNGWNWKKDAEVEFGGTRFGAPDGEVAPLWKQRGAVG